MWPCHPQMKQYLFSSGCVLAGLIFLVFDLRWSGLHSSRWYAGTGDFSWCETSCTLCEPVRGVSLTAAISLVDNEPETKPCWKQQLMFTDLVRACSCKAKYVAFSNVSGLSLNSFVLIPLGINTSMKIWTSCLCTIGVTIFEAEKASFAAPLMRSAKAWMDSPGIWRIEASVCQASWGVCSTP